ncbi:hypothetical protein GY976_25925, partial [Escherichia coli]|nr:hypothetical protein [Escherichia coli]
GAFLLLAACASNGGVDEACRDIRFEGTRFTVCRADPQKHELMLVDKGKDGRPMRDFTGLEPRLGERHPRIAFAMNAGMF